MEELVTSGSPDISYMDNEKRSPLHAAAFVGNSDIVEILIDQVISEECSLILTPRIRDSSCSSSSS